MRDHFQKICLILMVALGFYGWNPVWAQEPLKEDIILQTGNGEAESLPSEGSGISEEVPDVVPNPSLEIRTGEDVELRTGMKLNLNDCVQMAILNNKQIQAKNYDIMAAQYKLKQAQPRGVPDFDYEFLSAPAPRDVDNAVESFFSGNVTYFQRGKITFGSALYTFGKIGLAQDLAKRGIEAEKQKKTETTNEIVLKVKKLYYGILLAKDFRKLLQSALNHLESEINRRTTEDEGDPWDPIDMVQLKLYRYELLSRLSQLEKKDHLARHALRITMGLPRATEVEIVEEHLNPVKYELKDFNYYLTLSRKFQPKNQLLKIGLKAKELEYRLQKRSATPDVGVGGLFEFGVTTNSIQGLQLTDDFNDPFNFSRAGFGIQVKGKINPKRYMDKTKEKEAEYFKTALEKSAADEGLELDLRDAYLDVQQNEKNLENNRQAMKTARQYVFLTKTNIDIGVGRKKEYSDALNAYLLSQGRYLEAILKYNMAVATLEEKVGGVGVIYDQ